MPMLKISNVEICGWEPAIRGARNPMNSWAKSDSCRRFVMEYHVGDNDKDLMRRLCKGGSDHAKFRRMITVYVDINAPLYWWKEFDTYKVGTVSNSCSTMHKIHAKEFTLEDFSHEHLLPGCLDVLEYTISMLNYSRTMFLDTKDKIHWWQMIQLLPTSYNQLRTIEMNYEVLYNIYHSRRHHKLDEWHTICDWIESLPESWIITGKEPTDGKA
jgi:hypothetical protein